MDTLPWQSLKTLSLYSRSCFASVGFDYIICGQPPLQWALRAASICAAEAGLVK